MDVRGMKQQATDIEQGKNNSLKYGGLILILNHVRKT